MTFITKRGMKTRLAALTLIFISLTSCSPVPKEQLSPISRNSIRTKRQSSETTQYEVFQIEPDESGQCVFVRSEEGVYTYSSTGGQQICGLYLITQPGLFVEFEFIDFDIGCSKGGLLSVIDGWELNGQFFPGDHDHPRPKSHRFTEYCGSSKPWKSLKMSQNVGLVAFKVPLEAEGFTVAVRFKENPKPCNVILQEPTGVYTLRNYGRRTNCSVSIIYPESVKILATSVGIPNSRNFEMETGILRKCKKRGLEDYLEIKGGDGLDPGSMNLVDEICGLDSIPSTKNLDIFCGNTAVRLVSSGRFDNSITFSFDLVSDLSTPSYICPSLLEEL